ncbi:retinol dehydrogenase 13-like [Belonocnema kinseyi]|uniref:retinol dehydrogenase 13-like n=1 Tax=Belonocnema kinseyi TaxID=2817044 RepID=UPI00143D4380|nr:retinol dehydrogenase 13-like [Belonocnema kinseyi]
MSPTVARLLPEDYVYFGQKKCQFVKEYICDGGIGYYTALDLARRGAKVIMACRNLIKANEVKDQIRKLSGNENVVVKHLDLSSLKSVRNFAKEIIASENRLDILLNNAGAGEQPNQKTEDGLELELQNAEEGAQTSIYLAVSDDVTKISGKYFSDCEEATAAEITHDPEIGRKFWEKCCILVGLKREEYLM